jgi:hypothetical protein
MGTYLVISILSGVLFGVLDGVININPLAQNLFQVYQPIARTSVNAVAGVTIDLVYGFAMAAVFMLLYSALPGESGLLKGISFALLVWFFRVVMYAVSQWVMFDLPLSAVAYTLATGLAEMLVLGILYGFTLKPVN